MVYGLGVEPGQVRVLPPNNSIWAEWHNHRRKARTENVGHPGNRMSLKERGKKEETKPVGSVLPPNSPVSEIILWPTGEEEGREKLQVYLLWFSLGRVGKVSLLLEMAT